MLKRDFDQLVFSTRRDQPLLFELERDDPATEEDIERIEQLLGVRLAPEYREFLASHGAGFFGFIKVLGVAPDTDWYLPEHTKHPPFGFVPVADNETGDYYGLLASGTVCESPIALWDHETDDLLINRYEDFYALVAAVGLKSE